MDCGIIKVKFINILKLIYTINIISISNLKFYTLLIIIKFKLRD